MISPLEGNRRGHLAMLYAIGSLILAAVVLLSILVLLGQQFDKMVEKLVETQSRMIDICVATDSASSIGISVSDNGCGITDMAYISVPTPPKRWEDPCRSPVKVKIVGQQLLCTSPVVRTEKFCADELLVVWYGI